MNAQKQFDRSPRNLAVYVIFNRKGLYAINIFITITVAWQDPKTSLRNYTKTVFLLN